MYATEFQTIIDKPYIQIPDYEAFKGKKARIVILNIDDNSKTDIEKDDFIKKFTKNPINFPKDFKFNREEANAR